MATRSSCDDIDGIDNVLKTLSDRLMKDPRLDMVRTFENRALLNILRFQYYLQETNQAPQTAQTGAEGSHVQHADFGSPGNATLRATSTSPPNGKVSFHGRDLEIEEYYRVILQFVQIMQLARPLSKDMVDLENCIRNIFGPSQSDKGLPYPFTPYKEHHLDLRSLSYQNQICWKDRLWPIVSRKIERWKDNKTFQKFAKFIGIHKSSPNDLEECIQVNVDNYAEGMIRFLVVLLPLFLFASMSILYVIHGAYLRLVASLLFNMAFAIIVYQFSLATVFELSASILAYSALLLVFVASPNFH